MQELQKGWDQLEGWIRSKRLGRRRYVEVNVFQALAGFAAVFAPFLAFLILPDFNSAFLMVPIAAIGIAAAIVMILIYIATSMARLRDIGVSPNWFLVGLVPYVNVIFFVILALTEGATAKKRREGKEREGKKKEA